MAGLCYPGIYAVAISESSLQGTPFEWLPEITYIVMTNSKSGFKGRLQQFDNTISGKRAAHGGVDRVRYKHRNYYEILKKLYVSRNVFECDVESVAPVDLRVMGEVAKCEYDCFAAFC